MQKRYNEIDLAKGFAIILAVFGHAAPDAVKGFWIVGTDSLSASLHYFVYSFHMALFFACSGFLLYPKLNIEGGVNREIVKRFKRLMIPYFFLSFLYLGGKLFGGGLADNQLSDNPIMGILFGSSPCFGAWFLWCLFAMTIMVLLLRKVNLWALLLLFVAISYIPIDYGDNFMGVEKAQENTMWLVLGCIVRKHYSTIKSRINVWIGLLAAFIIVTLHIQKDGAIIDNTFIAHSIAIVMTISGIIPSFVMCYMIAFKYSDGVVYKLLKLCGDYCMDIYILSMFVLVPLRILYVNVGLMNFIPYYVWLVVATILGVILPVFMSKYIVRKVKPLKLVLLGG